MDQRFRSDGYDGNIAIRDQGMYIHLKICISVNTPKPNFNYSLARLPALHGLRNRNEPPPDDGKCSALRQTCFISDNHHRHGRFLSESNEQTM